MSTINNQRGRISIVELGILVIICGILSAVAIPKYLDLVSESKKDACFHNLGSLRSMITIYYANQAVKTGRASWPTHADLIGKRVASNGLPKNPYQEPGMAPDSVVIGRVKGEVVGTRGGWVYNPATGEIWPNTNVRGECGW